MRATSGRSDNDSSLAMPATPSRATRRNRARRRSALRWRFQRGRRHFFVTLAIAGVAGTIATVALESSSARIDAFGPTELVAVAKGDLEVGHLVQLDDLDWKDLPKGAVAPLALTSGAPSAVGRTVFARIDQGEPITLSRLAPPSLVGIAAQTPAGRRAVTLPVDGRTPPLMRGQSIDLYLGRRTSNSAGATPEAGQVIARDAIVLDADTHRATIAIGVTEVPGVAIALVDGTIVIAVAGPG